MTTSHTNIRAADHSVAGGWLAVARNYLSGRRALLIILVILATVAGTALNWSWLVAAGIAPVLLSTLPCLVMCGLGLCMNRLIGRSCGTPSSQPAENFGSQTTILPVLNQAAPDIAPARLMDRDRADAGEGALGEPAESANSR